MALGICFYVCVAWIVMCNDSVADTSSTAELTVADGVVPTTGSAIQLVCLIDGYDLDDGVALYKMSSLSDRPGRSVVLCVGTICRDMTFHPRYKNFSRNRTGLFMDITQLNRTEDQTWWRCNLEQAISLAESRLFLKVYTSPESVRYVDQSPGPTNLAVQSFHAECKTAECAYPAPTFAWFFIMENGTRQPFDTGTQVDGQDGGGCAAADEKYYSSTLTIPQFTTFQGLRSNTVTFVCGMNHTVTGWTYTPQSPPVTFAYSPIVKQDTFQTKILTEGDASHTLYCSAESNPPSTFTWYKEGVATPLKQKVGPMSDNSLTFTLVNVTRDDAGQYRCTADNGVSPSDEAILHIVVKYPAEVTQLSPNGIFEVDSDVTLTCKVDYGPAGSPRVTWFRQGVMAPLQTDSVSTYTSDFVIAAIQCDQMSNYICRAENDMGNDERMVEVLVKCPPMRNPILPLHQNVSGAPGSTISLAIHVVSYQLPVFTWRQPEVDVPQLVSQKLDQHDEGVASRLTIANLQVFGEYTVTVSNGASPDTVFHFHVFHTGADDTSTTEEPSLSCPEQTATVFSVGVAVGTGMAGLVLGAVVTGLLFRYRHKCSGRCCEPMYMDAKPREEEHTYSDVSPGNRNVPLEMPDANIQVDRDAAGQQETYENL